MSHLVHLVGLGVVSWAAILALELALGLPLALAFGSVATSLAFRPPFAFVLALVLALAEGFSGRAICSEMPTGPADKTACVALALVEALAVDLRILWVLVLRIGLVEVGRP